MKSAIRHCTRRPGIWAWASNDRGREPDVVMVGCGDIPTRAAHAKQIMRDRQIDCRQYAHEYGIDRPQERNWVWPY